MKSAIVLFKWLPCLTRAFCLCLFHIDPRFPGARGDIHSLYPIQLQAHSEWEYFNKREGLKFSSLLKNPMFLMMGFSALTMFLLPKVNV